MTGRFQGIIGWAMNTGHCGVEKAQNRVKKGEDNKRIEGLIRGRESLGKERGVGILRRHGCLFCCNELAVWTLAPADASRFCVVLIFIIQFGMGIYY